MNSYTKIFRSLNLPEAINRCAEGSILPPLATFKAPPEWFGFPPALLPIWSDGSGPTYIGIWKHWFMDREISFVKMYVNAGRMTIEIARTVEQLFSMIAMMSISERDGIESDLLVFVREVGITNLDQIDAVSLVSGDEAHGLVNIDQFKDRTPLESVNAIADYSGEFPTGDFHSPDSWLRKTCSFEISNEILRQWPASIAKPAWLENSRKSKFELFREYLSKNDFQSAWLTLNSTGWTISNARTAISDLGVKAKNNQFDLLVDAWLSVADENAGGY
ncbi:hypothetical protein IV454_00800 [Massilia antarctica]|uniref:Uncharacterized protein n=1 Tax=Massilia antarctica TaxID=2765360 RepID=A0AA48WFA6_9BURK|nr:hypothetical protein [Massilia antarctica]QPI50215.1 hypothetical protein IV454_00800 [Massilia antarctica]